MSDPHPSAPAAGIEFSEELRALSERYQERPASLGEVLDALGPRASALLIVICALPFSTPVSIPGLSTPFGLVILILATRYFFGLPPWLPGRLRRVVLPGSFFTRVLGASSKLVGWLERRLSHRVRILVNAPWKLRFHTGIVIFSALLLMLPLPPLPPFTNTLPALVAVVMTFSVLERDGAGVLAGYGLFAFTVGYFVFWGAVVVETFNRYGGKLLALLERLL
ncbi:MAG: exopolysaccharide biosynthesis protein [Opitutaceae bacterium]|jgi:hypothetical protein|nr:exopolysaccharide biosynthesis protein [Opitutaceae bacterium]